MTAPSYPIKLPTAYSETYCLMGGFDSEVKSLIFIYKLNLFICDASRFMNNRVPPNKRYQPTEYEHAANCATHAVNAHSHKHTHATESDH